MPSTRGELALLPHRAAAAGMQRVAAACRVVIGDAGARLHRHAGDAADVEIMGDDMRGLREGAVGRRGIAETRIDQDIVRHFVPDRRRAGLHGVFGMQHEGQFVVDDGERLGGIERLRLGFRDHHGDGFADMARFVGGQQQMRADEDLAAAGRGELHVVARFRQRIVADGAEAVGGAIGAGEDAEHAGHRSVPRALSIDTMRACACGERTIAACAWPGKLKSSVKRPCPVTSRASSWRGMGWPMKRKPVSGLFIRMPAT